MFELQDEGGTRDGGNVMLRFTGVCVIIIYINTLQWVMSVFKSTQEFIKPVRITYKITHCTLILVKNCLVLYYVESSLLFKKIKFTNVNT